MQYCLLSTRSANILWHKGAIWLERSWPLMSQKHDDVIKWKHLPRYWPFVRGIHRFPVNSPHKGQWRGALMFSLICVWINGWVNNREAGDFRRYRANYDVTVMNCLPHKGHLNIWEQNTTMWMIKTSTNKYTIIISGWTVDRQLWTGSWKYS